MPDDATSEITPGPTPVPSPLTSAELLALDPTTTDTYGTPRRFSLHDYFGESAVPARKESRRLIARGEMDIEGLAAEELESDQMEALGIDEAWIEEYAEPLVEEIRAAHEFMNLS